MAAASENRSRVAILLPSFQFDQKQEQGYLNLGLGARKHRSIWHSFI